MPAMGGAAMVPMGAGGGGGEPLGVIRNPVLVALISYLCCPWYGIYQLYQIEGELNRYLGKSQGASILWFLFALIPLLSMPKLIGEARAKAGTATQGDGGLLGYLFLGFFLIPKDANEIWERLGVQPT